MCRPPSATRRGVLS